MNEEVSSFFRQVVDLYYTDLYRFAYSLSKNEHQACDLTQQTFAIYGDKGDSLRDTSKAKSWLFTTLYREFLRQNRKMRRIDLQDPSLLEQIVQVPATPNQDTLDQTRVMAALQELEERYREPLVLFYLRSFTYQEIAETLEIPMGTIMSRLSRGKCKLKEIFLQSKQLSES